MASARTFTSDIYAQMLDNPTLSGDQRLAIQRMQADARGARSKCGARHIMISVLAGSRLCIRRHARAAGAC